MVRWARKRAGMTQQELARGIGIPQPSIARIERGTVIPRTTTLIEILHATGHELVLEPRTTVGQQDRKAIRDRLALDVPRRTWKALGRAARDRRASPTFILRRLRVFGVRFVLIGDLAEVAHGAPTAVGPVVEVCHSRTEEDLERLATALRDLGASSESVDQSELDIKTDAGQLRLSATTAAGDGYDVLIRNANRLLVDTALLVPVAALDDLMRIRRAPGGPKDLEAEAVLRAIGEEEGGR